MSNIHNDGEHMEDQLQQIINEALSLPPNAISYHISQKLASKYPEKALLEGSDSTFAPEAFSNAKLCTLLQKRDCYNQNKTAWSGQYNRLYPYIINGMFEVRWQENQLVLLLMNWKENSCSVRYYWILADSKEVAEEFYTTVCKWNSQIEINNEIFVFEGGYWSKNRELSKSIKTVSFDNLILKGELKQDIQNNLNQFFASREKYENFGVPWRRNYLFVGPPGNGKTHTIKAIINQLQKPALYVRSFESSEFYRRNSEENIRYVFQQAREYAPCILVLEDLDTLINRTNRSFFLNELDGFASNQGIVILATTNYPHKIDQALTKRPSRFDRKYNFELPTSSERVAYIKLWNDNKLENSPMRLSNAAIARIAELTDSFSFAYLKELFVSSMMQWMETMAAGTMEKQMISQVPLLKEQMNSSAKAKNEN